MKPLAVVTVFNRLDVTKTTLTSIEPALSEIELVIVDNGSEPEVVDYLKGWVCDKPVRMIPLSRNIGCPRALNRALEYRQSGQAIIKLDNDVRILSDKWVAGVRRLLRWWEANDRKVGMVSAYYDPWQQQRVTGQETYEGKPVYHIAPVVGHAVWHTPEFMDEVGHFDVLRDDHLYGFEDLILSHKANELGYEMLAWEGWQIENVQRQNALGRETRDAHVEAMRPHYRNRIAAYHMGGPLWTNADGLPQRRPGGEA